MPLPEAFGALRERRFRLLFGSRTVSVFGGSMADIALAFAVLRIGSRADLGYVIGAREVPMVVLVLLGGVWADRLPRALVLVGSDSVRCLAQAATAALLLSGHASVVAVALVQIVYGGANAFGRPAYQGLVPQIVSAGRLQQANALLGLSNSAVGIAGAAIGGVLVAAINPGWALMVDAATFGVSALFLLGIRIPPAARAAGASVLSDFREGWKEFIGRRWVVAMVASFGIFQLATFPALLVLGPYVAKKHLGGSISWGIILAVETAGAFVGGVLALRVRFARPLVACLVLALPMAALLLMLGLAAPVWAISCVAFANGVCLSLGGAVWFSTLQAQIPEHLISRISSFDWFGSVVFNPLGYVLIGPLSQLVGVAGALYLSAAVNAGVTLAVLTMPSVRGLRTVRGS
jgi:MFS family permease